MTNYDIYYYRDRCKELEAELSVAQSTIKKLNRRLEEIQRAVRTRNVQDTRGVLETIAWVAYNWKD